jgi:hypothetical protein
MQNSAVILLTLRDDDMHAIMILIYLLSVPPIECNHFRDLGGTLPEHGLCRILRQPLIIREIEWSYEFPLKPIVGVAPK